MWYGYIFREVVEDEVREIGWGYFYGWFCVIGV